MLARLKAWAKSLYRDIIALWLAGRSADTPIAARAAAFMTAAYAMSPVDLIPDFIPVLGLLDDVLIVPLGIWIAIRLIPARLITRFRTEAAEVAEKPVSKAGLFAVVLAWGAIAGLCIWLLR